ncbi:alpha-N-arabinofuranosidase [Chondrinema litorale]|uniref:alpha-N-arabinofuranosidase n=1 Tax=Chondrinema litorale TaxID=2994555 RepID=UPI0025433C67|nr:alpha-L-arabinofuranosidase C-terminal domain-containing protein [Chondrinema litorale]UZR98804.1 alpha-N-arabinofuranosidase [Chondrinema litorale]
MNTNKSLLLAFFMFLSAPFLFAQDEAVEVKIDATKAEHTISRHIYGHFAEHLGRCIYGGFYVGEDNSKIENTDGIRSDVVAALKDLNIPNLRWPGGCFADTYHWKDGIGPKAERPSFVNRWWGGVVEDNSFGTHDFLNLCEMLDTEPYLAANVGSGTVQELIDWVYYVNHKEGSPMAALRKENGREEPWAVKYWGVGNEMWGCGGNMKPEYYANLYTQYSTFMTDWTNGDGLFRIASGANVADYHWTETLMKEVPHHLLEGVALHSYSFVEWNDKGAASDFTEAQYFSTMQTALKMNELVEKHSAIMDKYDEAKRIALIVDEWGGWYNVEEGTNPGFLYQQNTMRDAMIAGATLNIFNNHCERVRMANLAQTINVLQAVILTDDEKMLLTPTYHVMRMYKVHQDALMLPVDFKNVDYEFEAEKLPALSVSASKAKDGAVHISLVNIDPNNAHDLTLSLSGVEFKSITGEILKSEKLQDHNTFDNPESVTPSEYKEFKKKKDQITTSLPPFSVVVLELK